MKLSIEEVGRARQINFQNQTFSSLRIFDFIGIGVDLISNFGSRIRKFYGPYTGDKRGWTFGSRTFHPITRSISKEGELG